MVNTWMMRHVSVGAWDFKSHIRYLESKNIGFKILVQSNLDKNCVGHVVPWFP